ncbi:MAG: NFACT family protein [Spirochaetaceae bacterium]|nr:NFACT family protein [Spirochaetaceae bacterium]
MSLNCKEIDLILEELNLVGCFIRKVVQSSFDSITFYLYRQGKQTKLFFCLAPNFCRLHEIDYEPPKTDKPLRFQEFLKSHIVGGRINAVSQIAQERIVRFSVSVADDTGKVRDLFLFCRLWSSAANIILTDDNFRILDAFYRRPGRNEIPRGTYNVEIAETFEDKKWVPRDFFPLLISENLIPQGHTFSYNYLVEKWYNECAGKLSRTALVEQAEKTFEKRKSRIESAILKLEEKRGEFLQADKLKKSGDLVLQFLPVVREAIQKRQNFFECEDYETGEPIKISIDVTKSPQENAKLFYEKYKKAIHGIEGLEDDIRFLKSDLEKLTLAFQKVKTETNPLVIQKILRKQVAPKHSGSSQVGLKYEIDGWTFLVGRSAAENDELLRHHVKGFDWWFHVRDFPGSYVFVKNRRDKTLPLEAMLVAANLAVFYSKARRAGEADLYYTRVKYLRRAKNAPKGTVLPFREKNFSAKLNPEILKKIERETKK